jgi:hypothetical protein
MFAIFRKLAFSFPDPFRETAIVPRRSNRKPNGPVLAWRHSPQLRDRSPTKPCCDEIKRNQVFAVTKTRRFLPSRQAQTFTEGLGK